MHTEKPKWMAGALTEANQHRKKVKVLAGCRDDEILQVNVMPLYALGTAKKTILDKIKNVLATCKGLTVIFYTVAPKRTHRMAVGGGTAVGVDDEGEAEAEDGEDSGIDADTHDFDGDGKLPELFRTARAFLGFLRQTCVSSVHYHQRF